MSAGAADQPETAARAESRPSEKLRKPVGWDHFARPAMLATGAVNLIQSFCLLFGVSAYYSEFMLTILSFCLLVRVSAYYSEFLLTIQSFCLLFRVYDPIREWVTQRDVEQPEPT